MNNHTAKDHPRHWLTDVILVEMAKRISESSFASDLGSIEFATSHGSISADPLHPRLAGLERISVRRLMSASMEDLSLELVVVSVRTPCGARRDQVRDEVNKGRDIKKLTINSRAQRISARAPSSAPSSCILSVLRLR
jgi:hypothetical protein